MAPPKWLNSGKREEEKREDIKKKFGHCSYHLTPQAGWSFFGHESTPSFDQCLKKKTFFMSSLMIEHWKASLFLKYVKGNVHNGLDGEQCVYLDMCLSPFLESESNTHDGLHSEGGSQGCVANIPDICHLHYMWCMCKTFQTCVKVPDWTKTL